MCVVAARRPLRSRNANGGRTRNVVARDYTHARYIAPERRGTRAQGETKRHRGETERKGGGKKRKEEVGRHARGATRLVEYVLPRGVGIIAPVGRGRAANGTGCFALVETADKSWKLNRRHRLPIGVSQGRRMRHVGHKENPRTGGFHLSAWYTSVSTCSSEIYLGGTLLFLKAFV